MKKFPQQFLLSSFTFDGILDDTYYIIYQYIPNVHLTFV